MSNTDRLPATDYNEVQLTKPMRFGTEVDFHIALAELKWIRQRRQLYDDDFKLAASKYQIPKDMLVEALNGNLRFPDDYMISKSRWFPVLYSWALDSESSKNDLFLKVVHHERARQNYASAVVLVPTLVAVTIFVAWTILQNFGYSLTDFLRFYPFFLPAIPLYIGLLVTMRLRIGDNWKPLNDHLTKMIRDGRGAEAESLIQFLRSKEGSKAFSSLFFLHKNDSEFMAWYERMPQFHLFQIALVEITDSQLKEMEIATVKRFKRGSNSSVRRFFSRLSKRSVEELPSEQKTLHKIPIVLSENPPRAYRERMKKILKTDDPSDERQGKGP